MLKPIFDVKKIGVDYFMCSVPIPTADAHKYDSSVTFTQEQLSAYQQDMTHPSVQYIPNGWNGHKWWMVNTPFPEAVGVWENPCIFYADDQQDGTPPVEWNAIQGNPIVKVRTNTEINSDPVLFIDTTSGKAYCFSRENTFSGHPYYWAQESTDGVTWTARPYHDASKCVIDPAHGNFDKLPVGAFASASMLVINNKYTLFGWWGREGSIDNPIQNTGRSGGVFIGNSNTINGVEYDYAGRIGTKGRNNLNPWHGDVFLDTTTGYYYFLAYGYDVYSHLRGMYLGVSKDNLKNILWYSRPLFMGGSSLFYYKPAAVLKDRELIIYGTIVVQLTTVLGGIFFNSANYPRGAADVPNQTNKRHNLPFMCHTNFDKLVDIMESDVLVGGETIIAPY